MRSTLLLAALALTLSSCSMNDCCPGFVDFRGITETDADGMVIGSEDADDWEAGAGSGGGASTVQIRPASPNPATDETFVEVVLAAADDLNITIQRENNEAPVLSVLSEGGFAAGVHRLRIDRPASAPGLFRVTVTGSTFSTYGDVVFE